MTPLFKALTVTIDGKVASLTLTRPAQGNAFDDELHREFAQALKFLRENAEIRVILLAGAGKTFSAGGDFDYIHRLRSEPALREAAFKEGDEIFDLLSNMHVPIVAALHGHAMGLGATMAIMCDVIVAWKGAKIADPHVQIGLAAGDGGVIGWTSAIGYNRARRYLLTGDALTGEQAFKCGLVTDLAETPEDAVEAARAIATRIAALPPMAVQGTKKAFNALAAARNGEAQKIAFDAEQATMMSEDIEEALRAASERRTGIYNNR